MSKTIHNKITHLTSAHGRYDTRIFIKMCSSLADEGYDASLVVADGLGDEIKNKVNILDVGAKTGGRISRMTKTVAKVYKKALELDADIYHLHDPELMPIGLKLKKRGKKVIFDAHEDLPKQLKSKPYLNPIAKILLSKIMTAYEHYAAKKFDAIITATPYIRSKFLKINSKSMDINNYPLLDELANSADWTHKKNEISYVGGIAQIRGIEQVIDAMAFTTDVTLNLVGAFSESAVEQRVKRKTAWQKVNELGFLDRSEVRDKLASSIAGIVTFLNAPNHIESQPNKMFEYMSAGIPVISSNFPLWREIIEDNQCGICIDPTEPKAIGRAIQSLVENPQQAKQMGIAGRKAVEQKYNWTVEEQKLFSLYKELLS